MNSSVFARDVLRIDVRMASNEIEQSIRDHVFNRLRRGGAVVGMSGGIDSSVVAALCVRALGKEKVIGLLMPERDSSEDALRLGSALAQQLGIECIVENIRPALVGLRCYERQDEAIRAVYSDYSEEWLFKITLPSILDSDRLNISQLVVLPPGEKPRTKRMPLAAYLKLVAATNFKQRVRKMVEYYHADRLGYAVAGTPNLLEYDQGFFVKQGDGAADFKPIAHLYKTQVYALAEHLGVPREIRSRHPTTDTFSMAQGQDEFYFALPYEQMDLCLYAYNHDVSIDDAAPAIGITPEQVARIYRDIEAKRRVATYLHARPLLVHD